jgi:hypothetical protein
MLSASVRNCRSLSSSVSVLENAWSSGPAGFKGMAAKKLVLVKEWVRP